MARAPELVINQSVPLPEDKIGWVIGKNGSYVQQLAIKSGAVLRVSDSTSHEYGRTWKYVQISGPPRAVDRAKKLLHIRLERLAERPTSDGPLTLQMEASNFIAPPANNHHIAAASAIGAAPVAAVSLSAPAVAAPAKFGLGSVPAPVTAAPGASAMSATSPPVSSSSSGEC